MSKKRKKISFLCARELAVGVTSKSGIIVTSQIIKNFFYDANILERALREKPFISETNRTKKLEFANAYVSKSPECWKNIIFSCERKFSTFGSFGKKTVWRKPNTSL